MFTLEENKENDVKNLVKTVPVVSKTLIKF